ncbi:basic salivary proline-rich protein 2-like [Epinephelus fuscoguttatus]|uniref:basic salivary proline-rich protein 2-like n=1 Tax=Epinephelus fuscoguttatus TaxID=293821 RepID=UPI0020D1060A|nr:basic salivary proline-rich protein 2-like [Epinephelus fuscoguttatus]
MDYSPKSDSLDRVQLEHFDTEPCLNAMDGRRARPPTARRGPPPPPPTTTRPPTDASRDHSRPKEQGAGARHRPRGENQHRTGRARTRRRPPADAGPDSNESPPRPGQTREARRRWYCKAYVPARIGNQGTRRATRPNPRMGPTNTHERGPPRAVNPPSGPPSRGPINHSRSGGRTPAGTHRAPRAPPGPPATGPRDPPDTGNPAKPP